jgi:hypothetical protein
VVRELRIYFEGHNSLIRGFRTFLFSEIRRRSAGWKIHPPIATRGTPIDDYRIALRTHPDAVNILLLDAEQAHTPEPGRSEQLRGLPEDRIYWMISCMEAWFLADPQTLQKYYGSGFRKKSLPGNSRVEEIPKADVMDGLSAATKDTIKRRYHKTIHAPDLLESISADHVRRAAPECERLFVALEKLLVEEPQARG